MTSTVGVPDAPSGLGTRGSALWVSLHLQNPALTDPEREIVLEACRTVDRLDQIEAWLPAGEPFVTDNKGTMTMHPGFVEARQQANILKQLIAALRLPDEKTGTRPQQRGGARGGVYKPREAANVTSLRDRLRTG